MKALVVYESMFGNTEVIARAVAEGLSSHLSVDKVEVSQAPAVIGEDVHLLVVGGPTHAFGLSRTGTRKSAAEQATGPLVSAGIGLREWLDSVKVTTPKAAVTFDTRISKPRVPGSAARGAAKRLRRLGLHLVAPPENFYVDGTKGPLLDGESARAERWGEKIAADTAVSSQVPDSA